MDLRAAAQQINSAQRRKSDPPLIHILECSSCGKLYARLPQDIALAERNESLQLCNLCLDTQRKSQKSSRLYARRNSKLKWSDALGIAFPKTGSQKKGDGPYTEIMQRFEIWLRDVHNYVPGQEIEWETRKQLQKQFYFEFVEEPNLYSTQPLEKLDKDDQINYRCTGCQSMMSPNVMTQCCPTKKTKSKA
ncbi:hypothetical protein [Paenibacillus sp. FSL H7-0714]|uniref:hypothetical protein n=1 Tax=Paenibacillus sp. FSL H7-0714 TaxID=2954735 RepID=UPI0030F683F5